MINRPILIILLGYLVGIIIGLYCKISIAIFIIPLIITYLMLKQKIKLTNKKYIKLRHYIKILKINKAILIFLISTIIANTIVLILNNKYNNLYKNIEEAEYIATILEGPKENQYSYRYKIQINSIDGDFKKYKGTKLYLNLKQTTELKIGDKVKFTGEFIEPEIQRNYGGFNYKEYLKSIEIFGTVNANQVKVIEEGKISKIKLLAGYVSNHIKNTIKENIEKEDNKNLLLGVLLGNDDNLENEIKENFQNSSISHLLAVSGMHVSYVILGISMILSKLKFSRKTNKICTILFLIFFIFLTGETPSVKRACFMAIMSIIATLIYRKSDTITNISTALLIILINNPFSINDIGLILSFSATIGIYFYYKLILNLFNIKTTKNILNAISNKLKEIISVSFSAQITIFPISMLVFNKISLTFFLSNILVSLIIGIIIILGFLTVIFPFKICFIVLELLLEILKKIAEVFSNIPFSNVIVVTPKITFVICYYVVIILIWYLMFLRKKEFKRKLEKQLLTYVDKFKLVILKHKKQILIFILSIIIINQIINLIPKDLIIHFIDVGQGDSCLIITPKNKTILIDGGGSATSSFDVRKKHITSVFVR